MFFVQNIAHRNHIAPIAGIFARYSEEWFGEPFAYSAATIHDETISSSHLRDLNVKQRMMAKQVR